MFKKLFMLFILSFFFVGCEEFIDLSVETEITFNDFEWHELKNDNPELFKTVMVSGLTFIICGSSEKLMEEFQLAHPLYKRYFEGNTIYRSIAIRGEIWLVGKLSDGKIYIQPKFLAHEMLHLLHWRDPDNQMVDPHDYTRSMYIKFGATDEP